LRLLGFLTLLVVALGTARALDPLPVGLTATYFSDEEWSSTPIRSVVDDRPSTERLFFDWQGEPPPVFSATWRGALIALHDDIYTFGTRSDDGSWVYVDGALVVENPGRHEARIATGTIRLSRGVHAIFIKYFQGGGDLEMDLLWARASSRPASVPSWALAPRSPAFGRFLVSAALRVAFVAALWLWLAALALGAARVIWARARRVDDRPSRVGGALLALGCVLLFFVLPHDITSDAYVRFLALAKFIEWHYVSGTAYSFVGPLASLPLYQLGKLAFTPDWWCARFNTVVFMLGLWFLNDLLRDRLDRRTRVSFLLLLVAGSMFPNHLQDYFAEVFTAVVVAVGLVAVERGRAVAGWTAAATGVVNTPAAIGGLALAAARHTWDTRRLRHLAVVAVAAAGIMLEAWLRRGSPFTTGYEGNRGAVTVLTYSGRPGFSYPMFFGLLSVLFSFGRGILFYAPGLVLRVRGAAFGFFRLWIAFLAGLVLVYSKWWAWEGGLFWGPRFFLFASIPASLAIAVWLARVHELTTGRLALLFVILTLSVWVAIDGAAFGYAGLDACRERDFGSLCNYVPEFSALWRPFVQWTRPSTARLVVAAYFCVVYVWLAAPVVQLLVRKIAMSVSDFVGSPSVRRGWRI